ncbi:MAG: hypothetical protein KA715_03170 [Xanthomonadaceae bacterium]|nr:hypothetical protein [Xanthomonadaceae bacterium]
MELNTLFTSLLSFNLGVAILIGVGAAFDLWSEKITRSIAATTQIALLLMNAIIFSKSASTEQVIELGNLIHLDDFHFPITLQATFWSGAWAILSSLLLMIIGRFSRDYLHRERGYHRFYFLMLLFQLGVNIVCWAGVINFTFLGWEITGLTSVLLIAFFWEKPSPLWHSLIALTHYRISDCGFLLAIVFLEHNPQLASLCLLFAAFGKSAQVPFTRWLPRAMEGPTPSSAIFYGALSIHTGPFIILKYLSLFESNPVNFQIMIAVGLITLVYATWVGRVQASAKGVLAYSTLAQVGIIWTEIGLGFTNLAWIHLLANASLRTVQFLRAGAIIDDFRSARWLAPGEEFKGNQAFYEKVLPEALRLRLYVAAQREFYLGEMIQFLIIKPFYFVIDLIRKIQSKTGGIEAFALLGLSFFSQIEVQLCIWVYLLFSALAQDRTVFRIVVLVMAQLNGGIILTGSMSYLHQGLCSLALMSIFFLKKLKPEIVMFFGLFAIGAPLYPTFLTTDLIFHTLEKAHSPYLIPIIAIIGLSEIVFYRIFVDEMIARQQ